MTTRRSFMQMVSASMAAAGLAGCGRPPPEGIVPYLRMPENLVPGNPQRYATSLTLGGIGRGVVAETHEGRPTRIDGNPNHPASLGATDIFAQAAVLDLYDGARARAVRGPRGIESHEALVASLARHRQRWSAADGAGLAVLTEPDASPGFHDQLARLRRRWPGMRWFQHETLPADNRRHATRRMLGHSLDAVARLDRARVVASFDHDVLGPGPAQAAMARQFAATRDPARGRAAFSRWYALESTPGLTGASADHRLPVAAVDFEAALGQLAAALGVLDGAPPDGPLPDDWVDAMRSDLEAAGGAGLVLAGDHLSPRAHALAMLVNDRLGATGETIAWIDPVSPSPDAGLTGLAGAIDAGEIRALLMLCEDPWGTAPGDLPLAELLGRLDCCVHHSLYAHPDGSRPRWHVPQLHELESWGDARAWDGTASLVQPVTAPLFSGFTRSEFLRLAAGDTAPRARDLLRRYWQRRASGDFERWWHDALANGVVPESAARPREVRADPSRLPPPAAPRSAPPLTLRLTADESLWDGRYARNPWLQELPRPLTKTVWGHCALLAPATAARGGLADGARARLETAAGRAEATVCVLPGHAENQVSLSLAGAARPVAIRGKRDERFVPDLAHSFRLRSADGGLVTAVRLTPLPESGRTVVTQRHFALDPDRHVRSATLDEFLEDPERFHDEPREQAPEHSMYPPPAEGEYAWAMTIDLNRCIGCNACTIACQAENNVPTVGPEEARRGRVMHWIRVDRYRTDERGEPRSHFQPVPCMHCEYAPCELVCPTEATLHDDEGLNLMVYNRCIGTRDCSQNCPYKVRRFNFLDYNPYREDPPLSAAQFNPDVTVRSRGVMEKCTYCIQRISRARRVAKAEDRRIATGEVVTACQAACPAEAIAFGDLRDPDSRVTALKRDPRAYDLLGHLNTRPRTSYLAKLANPNPDLKR